MQQRNLIFCFKMIIVSRACKNRATRATSCEIDMLSLTLCFSLLESQFYTSPIIISWYTESHFCIPTDMLLPLLSSLFTYLLNAFALHWNRSKLLENFKIESHFWNTCIMMSSYNEELYMKLNSKMTVCRRPHYSVQWTLNDQSLLFPCTRTSLVRTDTSVFS